MKQYGKYQEICITLPSTLHKNQIHDKPIEIMANSQEEYISLHSKRNYLHVLLPIPYSKDEHKTTPTNYSLSISFLLPNEERALLFIHEFL